MFACKSIDNILYVDKKKIYPVWYIIPLFNTSLFLYLFVFHKIHAVFLISGTYILNISVSYLLTVTIKSCSTWYTDMIFYSDNLVTNEPVCKKNIVSYILFYFDPFMQTIHSVHAFTQFMPDSCSRFMPELHAATYIEAGSLLGRQSPDRRPARRCWGLNTKVTKNCQILCKLSSRVDCEALFLLTIELC